jgi:hypothetical protein
MRNVVLHIPSTLPHLLSILLEMDHLEAMSKCFKKYFTNKLFPFQRLTEQGFRKFVPGLLEICLKMKAFCYIAPCRFVEADQRFR